MLPSLCNLTDLADVPQEHTIYLLLLVYSSANLLQLILLPLHCVIQFQECGVKLPLLQKLANGVMTIVRHVLPLQFYAQQPLDVGDSSLMLEPLPEPLALMSQPKTIPSALWKPIILEVQPYQQFMDIIMMTPIKNTCPALSDV